MVKGNLAVEETTRMRICTMHLCLTGVPPTLTSIATPNGHTMLPPWLTLSSPQMKEAHEEALTNILLLASTANKFQVALDSAVDNEFCVHTPEKVIRFARDSSNLHTHHVPTAPKESKNLKPPAVQQCPNSWDHPVQTTSS